MAGPDSVSPAYARAGSLCLGGEDRAKQTQFGAARLASESQLCETKPISPERPGMGAGCRVARPRRRAIVQNEPNSARPGQRPDRRKVRNEPNSAGRPELRRQKCAKRTQSPTEKDTPPFQSDADGAKRSQTRRGRMGWGLGSEGRLCKTNPISESGPAGAGSRWYKRSQFVRRGQRSARAGEVTSGGVAWARCAKQTQFATDGQERPSPRPEALTMPPTREAVVRNKANFRSVGETECLFLLYSASGRW
jgi:hypothetical protein